MALDTGHVWPRRSLIKYPGRATLAFLEPIPPGMPWRAFLSLLEERIEEGCRRLEEERAASWSAGITGIARILCAEPTGNESSAS